MDRPMGSSGFDRGEMIPPVPAPRYKRKLITNEDSKHSSNKQNTCASEQTTEILPPPRRKHKHHSTKNLIPLTFQNNIKNESRESNFQVNTSSQEEKKIISNGKLSSTCNEKSVLEMEQRNHRLDPYKPNCLDLDEEKSSKMSEMTDAFREIVDSSILKNFINNRVLDIPLPSTDKSSFICAEQTLTQDSDVDDSEENRVNSSLSENSATIVGVFYKPEYSLLKQVNENQFFNSNVSKESNPTVLLSSLVNDGNKKIVVPPNESIKIIKINKKDSEEDDSGVYFSDTKSPPHRSNDAEIINKNMNEEINASSELQLSKPFNCNDRDTFDNKSSDLGPKMYNAVLDCFEAQTVSALREEVTGRLSLCSELSKNKAVENWLDHRDYISKKNVINSSFSEYLRNMLEVEESEGSLSRSLSPYPLSTVDESSDVSETGPNDEVEFVGESYTSKACTVPCSLSETRENRIVDTSDKYVSSLIDTNSVNNVNNECTEVTQCKVKSISFSETPKSNMNDIEMLCPAKEVRMSNENNTSQYNLFYTETNHYVSVSPSIEHGAVNKLISFFETVHTEENFDQKGEFDYEEEIDEITQGVHLLKQDSLVYSDTFSHVGLSLNNEINVIAHNNLPDEYENQPYPSIFEVFNGKEETFVDEYLEEENVSTEIIFPNGRSKLEHVASVHTEENLDQKGPFEYEEKIDEITQDVDLLKLDSLVYSDTFRHVDLSLNNEINAIGHNNFPDKHKNQPDPSIFQVVSGKEETFADEYLEEENISTESICPNDELELVASTNYDDLELYPSKIINVESFEQDIFPLPEKEICLPTKVKTFDFENPTTIDFEENENLMSQSNPSFDMSDNDMNLDRINYVIETQADFKELSPPMEFSVNNVLPVTLETNQVAGINDSIVPNFNVSTKDTMLESDDMFCSFKPTRIPIVILNETDILSAPIGSIELHPADCLSEDNHNQAMASEMCNGSAVTNVNNLADEDLDDTNEESMLESSVTVTLEKHWGSLGLKIKGDADGVVISDILAGGAAGQSGLIFQGVLLPEKEKPGKDF